MWFRRRKPQQEPPELTNQVYARWLRAQRPPFEWFVGQPELVQEQLALIGDEWVEVTAAAVVMTIRGQAPAGDEASAAMQVAERLLGRLQGRRAPDRTQAAPTMGGLRQRRQEANAAAQGEKDAARSFLGRRPDAAPPEEDDAA